MVEGLGHVTAFEWEYTPCLVCLKVILLIRLTMVSAIRVLQSIQ